MDLPSLHTKPSYETLLSILRSLELRPGAIPDSELANQPFSNKEEMNFLTPILYNEFSWFEDIITSNGKTLSVSDQKDILSDLASLRISERCGRGAVPQMTRTWVISAGDTHPEIRISLREPPLTEDNIGHKTWGTSHTIAKLLGVYLHRYFSKFSDNMVKDSTKEILIGGNKCQKPLVLELGSGTGLVGMAAAALWKTCVVVTDLPQIIPNLTFNADLNITTIEKAGGKLLVAPLDWSNNRNALRTFSDPSFEIILASDPLYDSYHPYLLADTINEFLERGGSSRALVAVPIRDATTDRLAQQFLREMEIHGLKLLDQSCEVAQDEDFNNGKAVNVVAFVFARS